MNFGIDTWILILLSALGVFAAFYFPIRTIIKERKEENSATSKKQQGKKEDLWLKKKAFYWIIFSIMSVLIGDLVLHLYRDKQPLIVFAGGGSVRNYLMEPKNYDIDVREYPNSINIALASGSSWRVLAEEYQFRKIKNPKLNKFTTICLSADTMSGMFYSEYMSNLDNTIIASVYLGDDNLVTYISKGILENWNMLGNRTIPPKTLAQIIDTIIETKQEILINNKRVRVFTTTKTSGTLEAYKKCLSNYINLEKMIDSAKVSFFYDNMDPKTIDTYTLNRDEKTYYREFIILGSQYYYVKGKGESLNLIDSNKFIPKKMYLYFLAQGDDNQHKYKIDSRILKFLNMLDVKSKKNNINMRKSEHSKWDGILKNGIIDYDKANSDSRYPNMIQIN